MEHFQPGRLDPDEQSAGRSQRRLVGRVRHGVPPQRVVDRDEAARSQEPQGLAQVLRVLPGIGVDEHQVVRAVGEAGDDGEGPARDQSEAVRCHARGRQRGAGRAVVLGVGVDARQHAVAGHAREQGDPGDAGAGAELDDGPRADRRRQEGEQTGDARADGGHPEAGGLGARRFGRQALGDEGLRPELTGTARHVETDLGGIGRPGRDQLPVRPLGAHRVIPPSGRARGAQVPGHPRPGPVRRSGAQPSDRR